MPGQGSPLVSASGQVFVSRSPSPFRVPRRPARPFLRTRCRSFWGEVIAAARAAGLWLDPSGLTKSAECPPLSRSTVTGRLPLSLSQPFGPPVRCFLHLIFDIQHEFDGLLSLGHCVAAVSRIG